MFRGGILEHKSLDPRTLCLQFLFSILDLMPCLMNSKLSRDFREEQPLLSRDAHNFAPFFFIACFLISTDFLAHGNLLELNRFLQAKSKKDVTELVLQSWKIDDTFRPASVQVSWKWSLIKESLINLTHGTSSLHHPRNHIITLQDNNYRARIRDA